MFEYVIEIPQTQVNEPIWSQQLRVAAYCRVSTPSGLRAKKRPGYQQMLRNCRKGENRLDPCEIAQPVWTRRKGNHYTKYIGRVLLQKTYTPVFLTGKHEKIVAITES